MALIPNNETLQIRGTLDTTGGTLTLKDGQLTRANLAQETLVPIAIPLYDARVYDAVTSHLPATASGDELGIINGTTGFGTDALVLQTEDVQASTATQKARFLVPVPDNYDLGESLTLRVRHGMITTVADTTSTVDVQVFVPDGDNSVGSDICETAAITSNSLTKANRDFVITPGSIVQGDVLDIVITLVATHSAATECIGEISSIKLLRDIKG